MSRALALTPSIPDRASRASLRVGILLLVVLALNAVDLAYTMFAHRVGMLNESNPIAETFLRLGLTTPLICYKVLLVGGGSMILWKLRNNRFAPAGCWILVAAYAGLGLVWYLWVRDVSFSMEAQMNLGPVRELTRATAP
jgi:hypothetical protein